MSQRTRRVFTLQLNLLAKFRIYSLFIVRIIQSTITLWLYDWQHYAKHGIKDFMYSTMLCTLLSNITSTHILHFILNIKHIIQFIRRSSKFPFQYNMYSILLRPFCHKARRFIVRIQSADLIFPHHISLGFTNCRSSYQITNSHIVKQHFLPFIGLEYS
jgi:hypothetical protein